MNSFNDMSSGGVGGAALGITIIFAIISFIVGVLYIVSNIKIYTKAGKPWWAVLVPIYNIIVLMDIANLSYKNLLFILIPIVGLFIFMIKLYIGLAKRFNKGVGYAVGLIFLPVVFLPLLAFSKDEVVSDTNNNENSVQTNIQDNSFETNMTMNTSSFENMQTSDNNQFVQNAEINNQEATNLNTANVQVENYNEINQPNIVEQNVLDSTTTIETFDNTYNTENNISSNFEELDINQISNNNLESVNDFNKMSVSPEINDINQTPVIEEVNNVQDSVNNEIETFSINNEQNQNTYTNNYDSNIPETLEILPEESSVNEELVSNINNNVSTAGKFCKTCGTEMPKIVTICPSCGTDNE